jgi:Ca2+/Na+ antiporter
MRVVDVLRLVLLLAIFAAAFAVWLGRVGVAVGGGGLAAVIVFAAFRGWQGKRKVDAAMREATADLPAAKRG